MKSPKYALLIAGLLALSGCSSESPDETEPEASGDSAEGGGSELESDSIRIGFTGADFTQIVPFRVADRLRDLGVDVEETLFEDTGIQNRALLAGEIDFSIASPHTSILMNEEGNDVKYLVSDSNNDYVLLVRPEIEELTDLEDKRLGSSAPNDPSEVLPIMGLENNGVDTSSIQKIPIGGTSARIAGLEANQIDAGIAHIADALAAIEGGADLRNVLNLGEEVPGMLQRGLITTDAWLGENPNLAQTVVDIWIDETRWAAENKDEYITYSEDKVEGLDEGIRSETWDFLTESGFWEFNGAADTETLERTVEIFQEFGLVDDDPPALDEWADPSFAEDYLAREGEL